MTEPIKQEIVSCIYENGEQLITGPVLQEVLVDMVDDYNEKISSGSLPSDLIEKTGSWDSASAWVEDNKDDLVHTGDLDEYATEAWVEEQGYLTEHQDISGLATTESVNQLSESVAESIADIPVVDLSGYATTSSVNEATESVKEWVEAKHYLTTASLSGSVTEESVGFMIGDATASVKEWVEEKNYATEAFVSESIAGIDIPDVSGYLPTASFNLVSASFDERINAITGSDLSGYATTESLNTVSQSISQSINGLADTVNGKAETRDLTSLSESVASDIDSLEGSIGNLQQDLADRVDWDTYNTERAEFSQSVASDITSLSESIAAITGSGADLSGYATTASVNQLSSSVANDFANLDIPDVSGFATTSSLEDLESRIESVEGDLVPLILAKDALEDVGIIEWSEEEEAFTAVPLATSESVSALSESVRSLGNQVNGLGEDLDTLNGTVAGLASTSSLNSLSESVATDLGSLDERVTEVENGKVDRDTYDTERAEFSQSVASDVADLSASIAAISGSDLSGYVTTASYNQDSASFDERINAITGSDLSGYATTASVNQLSSSVSSDIQNARTEASAGFASVDQGIRVLSASFDQRINDITGSSVDLSGYLTTASFNQASESIDERLSNHQEAIEALEYAGTLYWDEDHWSAADKVDRQEFDEVSASFDERISNITASGEDTGLRSFLFGTVTSSISSLDCSVTYLYCSQSSNATLGFSTVPEDGHSIAVDIFNVSTGSIDISIPGTSNGYSITTNGIDYIVPYTWTIPGRQHGNLVIIRKNTDLFLRTSVDISGSGGSGTDTELRNFLFGTDSTTGSFSPTYVSNWVWEISSSSALHLDAELGEGKTIGVVVYNNSTSESVVSFYNEYYGPYSVVNGVLGSGSFTIPAGQYGDIVATRIGDRIYFRTSVDLSDVSVDLSGYATSKSLYDLSESVSNSLATIISDLTARIAAIENNA